jgi:hypothetical protein
MKRTVTVRVDLPAGGKVIERRSGVLRGGVRSPRLGQHVQFKVLPTRRDASGFYNPRRPPRPLDGSLQVNIFGTSRGFRALGRYFLALAELDTRADPGFHQHEDGLQSLDGATRIDLVVHKVRRPI